MMFKKILMSFIALFTASSAFAETSLMTCMDYDRGMRVNAVILSSGEFKRISYSRNGNSIEFNEFDNDDHKVDGSASERKVKIQASSPEGSLKLESIGKHLPTHKFHSHLYGFRAKVQVTNPESSRGESISFTIDCELLKKFANGN